MNEVSWRLALSAAANPAFSTAFMYASFGSTSFASTSSIRASFSVTIPAFRVRSASPTGIWNVLPSRIRFETAGIDEQNLARRHAAAADLLAERLRDDALKRLRQHHADLRLPVGRELIDDAVDGRRRRWSCAACRRRGAPSRPSRWRSRPSRDRASRRPG